MVDYKEIIKKKRLEKNLSQSQLAKIIGITQPFMNEIESGRKKPSLDVLVQICEVLDIRLFPDEGT